MTPWFSGIAMNVPATLCDVFFLEKKKKKLEKKNLRKKNSGKIYFAGLTPAPVGLKDCKAERESIDLL